MRLGTSGVARGPFAVPVMALLLLCASPPSLASTCGEWEAWAKFKKNFVQESGRVVDPHGGKRTVSEGQAYALFFSLVANDRPTFERLLDWTEKNLARGDLTNHLPAWHWGRRPDGSWGVVDSNPASDADLWIAYTLAEAGRVWNERRFSALSTLLGRRILRDETRYLPNLGPMLLPAPKGFQPDEKLWRLNPSYVPLQLLRRLSALDPDAPWSRIADTSLRFIVQSAPKGFSPDWALFHEQKGVLPDEQTQGEGSYDAIRVYLWAGMLHPDDPAFESLMSALAPMAEYVAAAGRPPVKVDTASGTARELGPVGFSSAVVPFLAARGDSKTVERLLSHVRARPPARNAYYDSVLTLFALGWHEGHYHFEEDGALALRWREECKSPPQADTTDKRG